MEKIVFAKSLLTEPGSKGYPALSAWVASDDDFFVIRRFDRLNARVILRMQDRISFLEERLEEIDQKCRKMKTGVGDNGTLRHDTEIERRKILGELEERLEKYSKAHHHIVQQLRENAYLRIDRFVLDYSQLKARPKPLQYQVENVKNWLCNNQDAINKTEAQFITREGDLITVVSKSQVPIRKFVANFNFIKRWGIFREKRVRMGKVSYLSTNAHLADIVSHIA